MPVNKTLLLRQCTESKFCFTDTALSSIFIYLILLATELMNILYKHILSALSPFFSPRLCFCRSPMLWNDEKDIDLCREIVLREPYKFKGKTREKGHGKIFLTILIPYLDLQSLPELFEKGSSYMR